MRPSSPSPRACARAHPADVEPLLDRSERECALDSLCGACSLSANRVHFAGTCASFRAVGGRSAPAGELATLVEAREAAHRRGHQETVALFEDPLDVAGVDVGVADRNIVLL